jgi:ssDNA-binding Zn-finger/Zn-ribbon topoisomerase 1
MEESSTKWPAANARGRPSSEPTLPEEALAAAADAPRVEQERMRSARCASPIARWGRFGQVLACTGYPECKHARPIGEEAQEPEATAEICDLCQSQMVIKRGRFGQFLACSRYPDCKGRRPILKKIGVACPKDGGEITERKSKKGRTFYGCANYPNCDFTSGTRPLKAPCPSCGGLVVAAGRGNAKCTKCDWKGDQDSMTEPELAASA